MLAVVSGLIFVNGLSRLFNKNSYSTHLTSKAMVVYDSWGRVVNRAAWEDIAEIFPRQSETILGLGAWFKSTLAWRCNTSPKPRGLFAYTRGGKTPLGQRFDGFLPDPYSGYESVSKLVMEYRDKYGGKAS